MTRETCEAMLCYYFTQMINIYKEFAPKGKSLEASCENGTVTIKTAEFSKTMEREDIK